MLILARRWAEEFMQEKPGVSIYVEGGGSRTGIDALIEGRIDICTASRTLNAEEIRRLQEKRGSLGINVLCAEDALSIYLNPQNPVRDLTLEQVRGILTGRIRSWKEVGGEDAPIRVLTRSPNSGTYAFLEEHVLRGDPYRADAESFGGTAAITEAVASDRYAIGYGGLAYGPDVYHCRIEGVAPTEANVRSGAYPISRYLYLYTAAPPGGRIKELIDWILSQTGQEVVREVGYVPLWELR
jgi:phosphate transport system substrate-binding protein